jgi:hypothetical protein
MEVVRSQMLASVRVRAHDLPACAAYRCVSEIMGTIKHTPGTVSTVSHTGGYPIRHVVRHGTAARAIHVLRMQNAEALLRRAWC